MTAARALLAAPLLLALAAAPSPWDAPAPGPLPVGFVRLHGATCEVDAWYPAVRLDAGMRFAELLDDSTGTVAFLAGAHVPANEIAQLLAAPLAGSLGVPPAAPSSRPAPLVLIGQGNGQSAADQVLLAEDLASHGYTVATTPSPTLRAKLEREDQVGEFAEVQANDLAGAIATVAAALPVDTTHIGVIGYSFGARGALLLAMRDPRVRALVSLDGGIGTATGVASLRTAPSFRADAPLPPILHFYERLDSFMTPDFTLLRSLHARSLTLREVRHVHHAEFTTYGFATERLPGLAAAMHADPATASSLRKTMEQARAFLDHALR